MCHQCWQNPCICAQLAAAEEKLAKDNRKPEDPLPGETVAEYHKRMRQ